MDADDNFEQQDESMEEGEAVEETAEAKPTPKRRGPDKGQRKHTPAGLGQGRPAGRAGNFPETARRTIEADRAWMEVLEEIKAKNFTPYDMEIRVTRLEPGPSVPLGSIDAAAVQGDSQTSPAEALRRYITDYIHLQTPIQGPALYELLFCWKNNSQFFRRSELRLPSRQEIMGLKAAEGMRQGTGAPQGAPLYMPPVAPAPTGVGAPPASGGPGAPMPPQFGLFPFSAQQPWYPPPAAPPVAAPPSIDLEAERAKMRAELEREFEMQRMRNELDQLRREQQRGFGAEPPRVPRGYGYARQANPMDPMPSPQVSEDERIARIVAATLTSMGIAPQHPQPVGVGATPSGVPVIRGAQSGLDEMERALGVIQRVRKFSKQADDLFGGEREQEAQEAQEAQQAEEQAEPDAPPKFRFVPTGSKWKDGREVMLPIDRKSGEPILPTESLPAAMTFGLANPVIGETVLELASKIGPLIQQLGERGRTVGTGAVPQVQVQQPVSQPVQQLPAQEPVVTEQALEQRALDEPAQEEGQSAANGVADQPWNLS